MALLLLLLLLFLLPPSNDGDDDNDGVGAAASGSTDGVSPFLPRKNSMKYFYILLSAGQVLRWWWCCSKGNIIGKYYTHCTHERNRNHLFSTRRRRGTNTFAHLLANAIYTNERTKKKSSISITLAIFSPGALLFCAKMIFFFIFRFQ